VLVDVASTVVRLALRYVARDADWAECAPCPLGCGCLVVADRVVVGDRRTDVLVVRDDPASCQAAVAAVAEGDVAGVVLWSEPDDLRAVCDGIRQGLTVVPRRVIELGALAPRLSDRQRETLRLLAMGRSSQSIASALQQSESTAKRDIAELLQLFDAPNRTALVSAAASLGFVPALRTAGPTCSS
jgi:DNA-binding NarL/FixJ family response regulator